MIDPESGTLGEGGGGGGGGGDGGYSTKFRCAMS